MKSLALALGHTLILGPVALREGAPDSGPVVGINPGAISMRAAWVLLSMALVLTGCSKPAPKAPAQAPALVGVTSAVICNPSALSAEVRVDLDGVRRKTTTLDGKTCRTFVGTNFGGNICICQDPIYCYTSDVNNVLIPAKSKVNIGDTNLLRCPRQY
jgi:hypothetical protein